MNNQYNSPQPAPQQNAPQQPAQQQTAPQQASAPVQTVDQPQAQYQQPYAQPQYQQPNGQPQYQQAYAQTYIPPKPKVDPAVANRQKREAVAAFGDKLSDLMNTNPILKIVAKYADFISYGVTAVCVLFTIITLISNNINMVVLNYNIGIFNLGGEIGGSFIFPLLTIIFGGLSLCKKKTLPITVAMSAVSAMMFTRFIISIVTFATLGSLTSQIGLRAESVSVPAGLVLNFLFLLLEMAVVGLLTYVCWTYFLAELPPKPVMQQPYRQPYQQPYMTQPSAPQQTAAPQQQNTAAAQPAPQTSVPQQAVPQQQNTAAPQTVPQVSVPQQAANICPNCQNINGEDSCFCQRCGTKLK